VPTVETLGQALPSLVVEAVVDPHHPGSLRLHAWNGRRAATTPNLEYKGVVYSPSQFADNLMQSVRFAPPSLPFGSTTKLINSLRGFLTTYSRLQPAAVDLLVAFALASWFCDCMPVAPVLHLFGPDAEVSRTLRLLACICRRPILLGDVDLAGLAKLPRRLGATLLINQRELGGRIRRALIASTWRHFSVLRGGGHLDLFGAKALSCGDVCPDQCGFDVTLSPAQDLLPLLTDAAQESTARSMQSRLLRYRMVHYERVRGKIVDCGAFVSEMRDHARTWLAPICDCSALADSVTEEILRQSAVVAGNRFFEPRCVVAEAALYFCHKPGAVGFFVGELAEKANALLAGRHEDLTLSPKQVGLVLRGLGLHGQRVAEGYKVGLTDAVRQRIHSVASDYRVLSLDDGVRRCLFCPERTNAKRIQ